MKDAKEVISKSTQEFCEKLNKILEKFLPELEFDKDNIPSEKFDEGICTKILQLAKEYGYKVFIKRGSDKSTDSYIILSSEEALDLFKEIFNDYSKILMQNYDENTDTLYVKWTYHYANKEIRINVTTSVE